MKTRWSESCLLIGCLPHWCRKKKFSFWPYYISFINHACSIKMAGYLPRFFAFWLTLTSSRSYPVRQRLFMRGFGFRSSLEKWPARKACVVDKRDGWVFAKVFLRFLGPRHPGYQRFILACDDELRRTWPEDTSGKAARENNVVPRVSRSMKTQKITINSHQPSCLSTRMLFAQVTF